MVGDDNTDAWELLRVVSGLRFELVGRDVFRKQLVDGVGHTVDRLAIGVLLPPLGEEQSATRGRSGRLRNDQ